MDMIHIGFLPVSHVMLNLIGWFPHMPERKRLRSVLVHVHSHAVTRIWKPKKNT